MALSGDGLLHNSLSYTDCLMLVWKTQTLNINVASLRYRCLLPLRYLASHGIESEMYGGMDSVKLTPQTRAIIFVKSFHHVDVKTCDRAHQQGIPIILDLCDNIFIDGYGADSDHIPAQNFQLMAQKAAAIVTTGAAMKAEVEALLSKHPVTKQPVVVTIPDGSESIDDIKFAFRATKQQRTLKQNIKHTLKPLVKRTQRKISPLKVVRKGYKRSKQTAKGLFYGIKGRIGKRLRRYGLLAPLPSQPAPLPSQPASLSVEVESADSVAARQESTVKGNGQPPGKKVKKNQNEPAPLRPRPWPPAPGLKTVLWFGNHGAKYGNFGMLNILEVADALERVNQDCALRLMVISNNRPKYETHIAPLPFKTAYLPWHPRKIYDYIRASDVVIIPNSQSRYSICKSANRAVLTLSQGTPVVASSTPALASLEGCVWTDDWEGGLREYLQNPKMAKAHVKQAQAVIQETLSGEAIAQKWITLLNQVSPLAPHQSSMPQPPTHQTDEKTIA